MLLNDLPEEILIHIIKFLNNKNLKNLALVNKLFFELTKENICLEINFNDNKGFSKILQTLSLINHCHKIKNLIDKGPFCKFYLHKYKQLFSDNLVAMTLTSCNCFFGKNEITLLIDQNKSTKYLNLNMNFNQLESEYYLSISNLKKLKILKINNSNASDFEFKNCVEKFKLIELKTEDFPNLYLFNILIPTLTKISINRCCKIDLDFLAYFFSKHCNLKYIDLNNMPYNINISIAIAKHCKNITHLNLSYPDGKINDLDLQLITRSCKKLEYININCTFVGEKTALNISNNCLNLKTLLAAYTGITNNGLYSLIRLKKLKLLDLRKTLITYEGLSNVSDTILNKMKIKIINSTV